MSTTMPETDYYKVLGVSREASADEIRKAYRKLSRQYHPDMRPNDKAALEKFKEVQTAFDVLSDTEKREQYDRYGAAFEQAARGGGRNPFQGRGGGGGSPVDINDLFGGQVDLGDLFGRGFGGQRGRGAPGGFGPQAGNDLSLEIEVPFQVAAEGGSHELSFQRNGNSERLTVKIPPGVDTGSVIRLAKQGEAGQGGGPPGDLLVTIRVAPHPYFKREGNHLYVDLPLTVTEAALGAKVDVPTLTEGNLTLTIPPGTSSGAKLRLRGKGVMDRQTKQRGDEFAVIKIVVPHDLSPEAQELLKKLAEIAPQSPRQGLW